MMGPEITRESGREEDPCGDLGFTAFRYIAAEMSAAEAEAFEQRLAEDHAAREAVAEMVQLSELASTAIAAELAATPAVAARTHWMAPAGWMAAGAAACLALVATLPGVLSSRPEQQLAMSKAPVVAVTAEVDHAALVLRSAELRDTESRDDGPESWRSEPAAVIDESSLALAAELRQFDVEPTVPEWLLAAVAISDSSDSTEVQEN